MRNFTLISTILCLWALVFTVSGQDLAAVEKSYNDTRKKADLQYALAINNLTPKYLSALRKQSDAAKAKGDLDTLIAYDTETKRVADGLEPATTFSAVSGVAKMQEALNTQLERLANARDGKKKAAMGVLLADLEKVQTTLTKAGKIDEAIAAKQKADELRNSPAFLAIANAAKAKEAAKKWTVVFRSDSMAGWGTTVKGGDTFSLSKDEAPDDIRFLKITNTENKDFIVFPIVHEELYGRRVRRAQYRWYTDGYNGRCLGIHSRDMKDSDAMLGAYSYGGWGWGRDQSGARTTCWAGQLAGKVVLEFAVSNQDLSPDEAAKLLIDESERPTEFMNAHGSSTRAGEEEGGFGVGAPGIPSTPSYSSRRDVVPDKLPNSIVVPNNIMKGLGAASVVGNHVEIRHGSQAEWPLVKLTPGSYQVYVTCRRNSSYDANLTVQGARDTTRTRGKINIVRGNGRTLGVPRDEIQRIDFGRLQLGGPQKLQIICATRSSYPVNVYRVELVK